ncbi:MAG: leucine-rich repeat domain-containing protein [Candidatus Hydrogenedentes bacterium]|nr:leucine-rich repeat domain-containing protein [Candidatus Hydrogenedentota bacterium]
MNKFVAAGKTGLLCAALCVMLLGSGCSLFGVVYIPDKALQSAVRASLGKPLGILTRSDLRGIQEIQAPNLNIKNLEGLQHCESLTVLNLRGNQVLSLSPLNGLTNLVRVDLGDNRVQVIEAVAGWFFLEELRLDGESNDIWDWQPLVANAQAGGLGAGNVVVLPARTTLDANGGALPGFAAAQQVLLEKGVALSIL